MIASINLRLLISFINLCRGCCWLCSLSFGCLLLSLEGELFLWQSKFFLFCECVSERSESSLVPAKHSCWDCILVVRDMISQTDEVSMDCCEVFLNLLCLSLVNGAPAGNSGSQVCVSIIEILIDQVVVFLWHLLIIIDLLLCGLLGIPLILVLLELLLEIQLLLGSEGECLRVLSCPHNDLFCLHHFKLI